MSVLLRRAIQRLLARGVSPADIFSIDLWTGNSTVRDITTGLDSTAEGSLIWFKSRSASNGHMLVDTVRGASVRLDSFSSAVEASAVGQFDSFLADGYRIGSGSLANQNTVATVGWQFLKAAGFLDIVPYTGNGTGVRTIAHSLGVQAGLVLHKSRGSVADWFCQHRSRGGTKVQRLNLDAAEFSNGSYWNNTDMDDTNVTVGGGLNASGLSYIMYVFAHNPAGNIQCGIYVGNGLVAGPAIPLGWGLQYLLIKRADGVGEWGIFDTTRGIAVGNDQRLNADTTSAEIATDQIELTADGFKITTVNSYVNASGSDYIYMAIKAAS
jgi:hypothetical protein